MSIVKNLKEKRKRRVRKKILEVNRKLHSRVYFQVSNKHLYAQLINIKGETLLTLASLSKDVSLKGTSKAVAEKLAEVFISKINEKGLSLDEQYILDRGSKLYHGKVKVFADTLRAKGMRI